MYPVVVFLVLWQCIMIDAQCIKIDMDCIVIYAGCVTIDPLYSVQSIYSQRV